MRLWGRKCRGKKKDKQPPVSSSKLLNCVQHHMNPHPWALSIAKYSFSFFFFGITKPYSGWIFNLFWESVCSSNRFILQEVWMMVTHWADNSPNCTPGYDSNTAQAAVNLGCCLIPLFLHTHFFFCAHFGLVSYMTVVPEKPEDEPSTWSWSG